MARFSAVFPYIYGAALLVAAPAMAQVALVKATPAEGSSTAALKEIQLEFSQTLAPASSFDLIMTAMPGMEDHPPMKIQGFKILVSGQNMGASLPRALPTGSYELSWRAVGADGQAQEGKLRFNAQ